jgi:hypothetical protein
MAKPTQIGTAGLQGWRAKVGEVVAPPVAKRTPLDEEQVRAIVGATFLVLAVLYVVKSVVTLARR